MCIVALEFSSEFHFIGSDAREIVLCMRFNTKFLIKKNYVIVQNFDTRILTDALLKSTAFICSTFLCSAIVTK